MFRPLLCLLLTLVTLPALAAEPEKTVSSKIKDVTVFLKGAQVTREANVQLSTGNTVIVLENLSPNLNKNSIQVKGDQKFTILSVNHRLNYNQEVQASEDVKKINRQIKDLKFKLEMRQSLESVYYEEKNLLIANSKIGSETTNLNIEDLMDMADFYRDRLKEVQLRLLEINEEQKKIEQEIAALKRQRSALTTGTQKKTSDVVIRVNTKGSVTTKLRVSYLVNNAGWSPVYDIRSADINGPVELTYKAKVYQNSGFDWEKVNLKLSTGNPSLNGSKPNVSPWVLQSYDPYAEQRKREEYERAKEAEAKRKKVRSSADRAAAPSAPESIPTDGAGYTYQSTAADFTSVTQSSVTTVFNIKVPYTINSDGKQYDVEVQRHDLPVEYNYFAIPKVEEEAFLIAKISGWDNYSLLPGSANIYYQDTYVGKSYLDTRSTSDTIDISLGRDQGIVVARKKVKDFTKTTVAGSNRKVSLGLEISVRNTKKAPVQIVIEDQIPISTHKDIQISADDLGGATYDETTGKLTWTVTLQPGEQQQFRFRYTVKHPKDQPIANF